MKMIATYLRWGHYDMVPCLDEIEGFKTLSFLTAHTEFYHPVCVYDPLTNKMLWHPENPYRQLQENDPALRRFLLISQQNQWRTELAFC
ncbi:hypothetical protein [Tellurirhabdus bombi]|uniref:hypothetical protein n=1 Tax=Tellurirhabdus bombi TaxID=2907205 RepID=UPI001F26BFC5|nr:hypothetical protein [Tellurirhabdus bombi]